MKRFEDIAMPILTYDDFIFRIEGMVDSPDNFVPRPSVSTDKAAEESRPPQKPSRIWQFANKFGLAAFLTSVAVSPIIATGNAEQLVHDPAGAVVSTVDDLKGVTGAVVEKVFGNPPELQSDATEKVRADLKAQGINLGDPIMVTDPNTGEKRIEQKLGSIGRISTTGAVGAGVVGGQEPVFHKGASMTDEEIPLKNIQESGVNLNDLLLTEVYGGEDHILVPGEKPEFKKWVEFEMSGEKVFVADKFVTPKDSVPSPLSPAPVAPVVSPAK